MKTITRNRIIRTAGACLLGMAVSSTWAATIVIKNLDGPDEGFNDPTAAEPVGGNPETTIGAQRLYAFTKAAEDWGAKLQSNVTITVKAEMSPLDCDAETGTLGAAGTERIYRDFPGAIKSSTWYHSALANSLADKDLEADQADIGATFNSNLDNNNDCLRNTNWYYGVDSNPPRGTIDFHGVVLHEIGHGLGFTSFADDSTGEQAGGFPGIFEYFLEDHTLGMVWPDMTDAQRLASVTNTNNLHWVGPNVKAQVGVLTAGADGDHVRMYAPSELEEGSSVSHWDVSVTPDELMEPFDTGHASNLLTDYLMRDIGWNINIGPPVTNTDPPNVYCNNNSISVPDDRPNGANSTVSISSTGSVSNIAVSIDASHTYMADLIFTLSHNGQEIVLLDGTARSVKCEGENIKAVLWDDAPTSVTDVCDTSASVAISGTLSPENPLRNFDGGSLSGDWTLNVSDHVSLDTGKLNSWCLLPISHGVCDGSNVSLSQTEVKSGESLVCNVGAFTGDGNSVQSNGSLTINYSGSVSIQSLHVYEGGKLHIRYQAPPE